MNLLTIPGVISAILTLLYILISKNDSDENNFKKESLLKLFQSVLLTGISYVGITVIIFLINKQSPDLEYLGWVYCIALLLPGFGTILYFPRVRNKLGEIVQIDKKYYIERSSKYLSKYKLTEYYSTTSVQEARKVRYFPFVVLTLLTFNLSLLLTSAIILYRQQTSQYDASYPFRANEKIYLSSNEHIINQVVDDKGQPMTLLKGTIFSISKGETFDIKNKKSNQLKADHPTRIILDSVFGIDTNQTIVLKKGSSLNLEQSYDKTIHRMDGANYLTVKTIPGKTAINLPHQATFNIYRQDSKRGYYEIMFARSEKERKREEHLAFFSGILLGIWMLIWIIFSIWSIREMFYTLCMFIGIPIYVVLGLLSPCLAVVFWIIAIIILEILRRKFIKFCDDYFFIKKFGEQKSISFTLLIDKGEFDLYFEDQTRNMEFEINEIQRTKEVLMLYDKAGEERDSIQIFWYSSRWEILSEYFKELKRKTVIFFRRFHSS